MWEIFEDVGYTMSWNFYELDGQKPVCMGGDRNCMKYLWEAIFVYGGILIHEAFVYSDRNCLKYLWEVIFEGVGQQ